MGTYEEWANESARDWLLGDREKLLHYILREMMKLANKGVLPTWEAFEKTDEWKRLRDLLNKENQFMFRNHYRRIFKDTEPAPEP